MSKANEYSFAEIRSGLLVTLATMLLFGLLFASGSSQFFDDTHEVTVLFNYISGLEKNAPVHYAGHNVGKVTDILILGNKEGQVAVTIALSADAKVREDSEAFIAMYGFMGEKFVELTSGSFNAPLLREGQTIRGNDPMALNEIMKKGTELADEFQKATVSFQALVDDMKITINENREQVGEMFANLKDASGNVKTITNDPTNLPKINSILENLDKSSANLKEMTEDIKKHPWKLLKKGKEKKPRKKKVKIESDEPSELIEAAETEEENGKKRKGFLFF